MDVLIPPSISAYFAAAEHDDVDGLVACFSDDAIVADEDRQWRGHADIRRWRSTVATVYDYTLEVRGVDSLGEDNANARFDAHTHLEGNFPGGTVDLDYRFTVRDGLISNLEIVPTGSV